MFAPEASGGGAGVALLRVRFSDFGDASRQVPRARYRFLPSVPGWSFHNRFAGDYVLYGAGTYGEPATRANLIAARLRDGRVTQLPVPHSVDRIELLGRDAMVIGGTPRGLGFSTVELDGGAPGPRRPLRPSRFGRRARAGATPSSSAPTRTRPTAPRARSACRSPSAPTRRSPASSEARRRWSSFAASGAAWPRPASSRRGPRASSTTTARRAASTGTAMPGRSSGAAGPSPCSATSWSRASSPAAGSARSAGSASRRGGAGRGRHPYPGEGRDPALGSPLGPGLRRDALPYDCSRAPMLGPTLETARLILRPPRGAGPRRLRGDDGRRGGGALRRRAAAALGRLAGHGGDGGKLGACGATACSR